MVSKIRHTGIPVRDLDESLHFYTNLGFKVVGDESESGKFIDDILGFAECKVRTVKMVCSTGGMVELLYYDNPKSIFSARRINAIGCGHLAVTVDDVESLYKDLTTRGIKFIGSPASNGKVKVVFCLDPNGFYLELVEEL